MSKNLSPSTTTESAEFKNDHLSVKVEKFPECIAKLHITVAPIASEAAYAKAIKIVSKEVSIPGFRKGKAPIEVLKKNYGKFIDREWEENLLNTTFSEAVNLIRLRPSHQKSVKAIKFIKKSKEDDNEIFVEFEYAPIPPTIDLSDIKLKAVEPKAITDADVEKELNDLLLRFATWEPQDKIVEEGDYVDLDIAETSNPNELLCEDMRFIVKKDEMTNWMHNLVLGMKQGEEREGNNNVQPSIDTSILTDEEKEESLPLRFKMTLKAIVKPILPELDDALAKKYQAENPEDLKNKIREALIRQSELNAKNALRQQIIDQLLQKYPFDIPESTYSNERDYQIQRLQKIVNNDELSQTEKLQLLQKADGYIKNLPKDYRLFLLSKRFILENKINITQEEIYQATIQQLMASRTSYESLIDENTEPEQMRSIVLNHVSLEKAVDYMIEKAQSE